jgi:outer membrane protein assembly factor BamA
MEAGFETIGPSAFSMRVVIEPLKDDASGLILRALYDHNDSLVFGGIHGQKEDELEAEGFKVARYEQDRWFAKVGVQLGASNDHTAGVLRLTGWIDDRKFDNGVGRNGDDPIAQVWCTIGCVYGTVDNMLVPGFDTGSHHWGGTLELGVDAIRNERYYDGAGVWTSLSYAHGYSDDQSQYIRLDAHAMAGKNLHDRELSIRAATGFLQSLADAPVPFSDLPVVSGAYGLRGFASNRLRGASYLMGTAEYRWLVTPWVDAAFFVDYGGAFDPLFDGISTDRMTPSIGFGLYAFSGDLRRYRQFKSLAHFELAWAPGESLQAYLSATF